MNVAVIMAGGVGSRLGANIPKQYIEVRNKPVIAYTLEKFQASDDIDAIEVVCAAQWEEHVRNIGKQYEITKLKWIAEGGATAQDSIRNGVFALEGIISDDDIVLIHMSVSPMISQENITNGIRTCREKGNAFAALPCLFCMCKKINDEWSDQNAYKEDYVQLNMPWIMRFGELFRLYSNALESGIGATVRDYLPSLMFASGKKAFFYPDNDENRLKITTKADLDLFRAYLLLEDNNKGRNSSWQDM